MKSLQQFIAEHLEKLVITTAQKNKEKPVDENQESSGENINQETK